MIGKFKTKSVAVSDNPVFIVGEKPGRQRLGEETMTVWESNRSGDFMDSVLDESVNVFVTNICNYQEWNIDHRLEGIADLIADYKKLKPRKIIALGCISYDICNHLFLGGCKIVMLTHPSFVLRFNRDIDGYKEKLLKEIRNGN